MRGQFVRRDGLIIPNNISTAGAQMILAAAFQGQVPSFYAALVDGFPTAGMTSAQVTEPTIGVNGYARIQIPRSNVGWPTLDSAGGEAYIESEWLTWAATQDPGFSSVVNRICLLGTSVMTPTDPIYAMSAPFATPVQINAETPLNQRQFKYQIFI